MKLLLFSKLINVVLITLLLYKNKHKSLFACKVNQKQYIKYMFKVKKS